MKRIVSLLLSVLMIVGIAIPVYAEDGPAVIASGTVKDSVTWKVTEDGVLTIGGTGAMENYTAALKISALHYTKAPYYEYKDRISSLVIEEGVTSIGYKAFYGWSNLTGRLSIPDSVTTVSAYAFNGCSGFSGDLTIPDSVTSLGENAFVSCKGFKGSLHIGSGLATVSKLAFSGCSGLSGNLHIPDSITKIDEGAFQNCSGFTGNLVIPDSVTEIGDSAFRSCTGFHGTLDIGAGVSVIGGSAFYGCSGFTGSLTIGSNVTSIGSSAFRGCSSFTGDIVIPDSIQTINPYVFYDCAGFDGSVSFGNSVQSIGSNAFAHCNNISGTLTFPDTLTAISEYAFYRCGKLTGDLVIPDSVLVIGDYAFNGCPGFNGTLTIGNSVRTIGKKAFGDSSNAYRCHFTGSLVIPDSVTSIDESAFINNDFNGTLTLGHSLETIGAAAFANQYSATLVNVPVKPTMHFIGDLRIPDSVRTIGNGAFQCNTFNGILYLGNSLETIGNTAFAGCTSLTGTLHIPESVTTIGEDAFHAVASGAEVAADYRIKYGSLNVETFRGRPENTNVVKFFSENPGYITVVEESRTDPAPDAFGQTSYRVYCNDATHSGAQTDSNVNFNPQTLVARIIETTTYNGEILMESMTVTPASVHFEDFGTQQLGVIIYPDNTTNKAVTYTSSDETVAVVSDGGLITAVGIGSAVITVTAADGSGISKTVPVTVTSSVVPVSAVTLESDSMLIGTGKSREIRAAVAPSDATDKTLTYSSSDASVASVNADGVVTGVSVGTAVITVKAADGSGKQAVLHVQVYDLDVKAAQGMKVGETADLRAAVLPAGTDIGTITYESSDPSVVSVDASGAATALSAGTAVITVSDGSVTKHTTVTVADLTVEANTSLSVGQSSDISVTVLPEDLSPKSVSMISSDPSVARIEDGKIVGTGAGSATVTVEATVEIAGEEIVLTKEITVSCSVPLTGFSTNFSSAETMYVGQAKELTVVPVPADSSFRDYTVTVKNGNVAAYLDGSINALSAGTTTVTVTSMNDPGVSETIHLTVYDITVPADTAVETGSTADVSARVIPDSAAGIALTYSSTDEEVATVDENGIVTALNYGTTVISVTDGHITRGIAVTVLDAAASVSETHLKKGDTAEIQITVYPASQDASSITLTSSDESVARIEDGKIVAVGNGSADITAVITVEVNGCEIPMTRSFTVTSEIPVTGLRIDNLMDPATMYLGEEKPLAVTVTPDDAASKALTYSSSDPSVVSVDENGNLTANAVGTSVITVTAADGSGAMQTVTVTVYYITLPAQRVIEAGKTAEVNAKVIPDGVTDVVLVCSSSNEEVATVDENGIVNALSYGTAVISVTDGHITKDMTVTVVDARATVTSDSLKKGDVAEVQITVYPDTQEIASVILTSSDESAARIEDGKITGVGNGTAEITADITVIVNGEEIHMIRTVTVSSEIPVTGLTVNNLTDPAIMYLGEEKTLDITVVPDDAADRSLAFTSSDPAVVSVDENGHLIANAVGTAIITVTAADGSGTERTVAITVYDIAVPAALTVETGKTVEITPRVIPDGATEASFTYASTNAEIATVDGNGIVTAMEYGTAVVSVTDGNITKDIAITVVDADATVTNSNLKKDETAEILVTVHPDGADTVSVILTSSDDSVVTIKDGKIVGVGNGTAEITAEITVEVDGEEITLIRTVTVSSEIPVTGLTVNNLTDPDTMYLGEEKTLDVTVIPSDAANTDLTFTSSDPSVISVDENGKLTAIAVGTAVITVEAADGSGTAQTLTVTVYDITVPAGLTVEAGKTAAIDARIIPDGATEASFVYSSSDERVATVDTNGILTALEYGTAVVSVADGNITKEISITVVDADATVTNSNLKKGETADIRITVYPEGFDTVSVTLSSSDDSVAKIEDGKIVGVGNGTAEITVEITVEVDGEEITLIRTFTVTSEIPVTGLTINNLTDPTIMFVSEERDLEVTVIPEDATSKALTYSSSDPSVVTVDENGSITAIAVGSAVITVISADGSGAEASATVTVFSYTEQKDATPTEDGHKAYYSDIEGNKYIREDDGTYVPVSNEELTLHYLGKPVCENISIEPTCVDEGICEYAVYCVNCGKEISCTTGTVPATGIHIPGEAHRENETAPTCTKDGSYDLVICCTCCNTVLSCEHNTVPAHGHSLVHVPATEATPHHNGMKEHYECCICGALFFDELGEREASVGDLVIIYTFRCKRCDWYEANKDATGVYKIVVVLVHAITHLVQQINYWT